MKAMPEPTPTNPADDLALARAESRALSDQLRQARADLHRLGIVDQNRALFYASITGAAGLLAGIAIGLKIRGPSRGDR